MAAKRAKRQKKANGRPTLYSDALADRICAKYAASDGSLVDVLASNPSWPSSVTVWRWEHKHDGFRSKLSRAKDQQAERMIGQANERLIRVLDEAEAEAADFWSQARVDGIDGITKAALVAKALAAVDPAILRVRSRHAESVLAGALKTAAVRSRRRYGNKVEVELEAGGGLVAQLDAARKAIADAGKELK